jgi:hypothetical protein
MTRRADFDHFSSHVAFRWLRELCEVRFLEIDDLIAPGLYGVTLTLSYMRAIAACGDDMVNIHFVFMNADFILADGSLRSLLRHIAAGRSIVLGPSFRANAEAIEPRLSASVKPDSAVLAVAPRELVQLALAHPHPTTIAKVVNRSLCHSVQPNQFFWKISEQIMLARYYLIFMLCLKPERVVRSINSYCDYALIPEMCPSGDEVVMGDSDEFFMLELQRRDQETGMLRFGRPSDAEIAQSLATWTTAEHRRAARHNVVFHCVDLGTEVEEASREASSFVDRIARLLPPPKSHVGHFHWVGGVDAFTGILRSKGIPALPPELGGAALPAEPRNAPPLQRGPRRLRSTAAAIYRAVIGRIPLVTPFHPSWLDYRYFREALKKVRPSAGARILIVRQEPRLIDPLIPTDVPASFATPTDVLLSERSRARVLEEGPYTHAVICVRCDERHQIRPLLRSCGELLEPGGTCQVFIHDPHGEFGPNLTFELQNQLADVMEWTPRVLRVFFGGGRLAYFNRRLILHLFGQYVRHGALALLWILPGLAIALPLTFVTNFLLRKNVPSDRLMSYCSSALFQAAKSERSYLPTAKR